MVTYILAHLQEVSAWAVAIIAALALAVIVAALSLRSWRETVSGIIIAVAGLVAGVLIGRAKQNKDG